MDDGFHNKTEPVARAFDDLFAISLRELRRSRGHSARGLASAVSPDASDAAQFAESCGTVLGDCTRRPDWEKGTQGHGRKVRATSRSTKIQMNLTSMKL